MEAGMRNLSSPLDLVQERATSHFHRLGAQQQAAQQSTADDFAQRARYTHAPGLGGTRAGYSNRGRSRGGGRYPGRYPPTRQQFLEHMERLRRQEAALNNSEPFPQRRGGPAARANQRSSENMPVSQEGHPPRTTTTHPHGQRMSLGPPRQNPAGGPGPSNGSSGT
jgi:hypothetical protein